MCHYIDNRVEMRRVFYPLRSRVIENVNKQFKDISTLTTKFIPKG